MEKTSKILMQIERNLIELRDKRNEMLQDILKEYSPEIEDMITGQLAKGRKGNGEMLPDYSPTSVSVYGKPAGPMNLKDEGDFWNGITLIVAKKKFFFEGKDEKTAMLEGRYGASITDLSQENFKEIANDFIKIEARIRTKKILTKRN